MSKSSRSNGPALNRRGLLRLSTAAGVGAVMPTYGAFAAMTDGPAEVAAGTWSTPRSAVATTHYGKVRGYVENGVLTFKGVPYGAPTGGGHRWLPAKAPTPWDGEYPALIYGANCPQRLHDWVSEQTFLFQWTDGWRSEDMLKVNIWTSSLTGKRPVRFYIHGGGYTFRSAYELASQDGAQMARHHDVVSVTVNHRLNALGFLDVSELGGPAYDDSANVGMTDLVEALRWVRDNIASFGGDPDRVMIYGSRRSRRCSACRRRKGAYPQGVRAIRPRRQSPKPRAVPRALQAYLVQRSASRTSPRCRRWSGPGSTRSATR
jgi:para-nitrobenzyl esterase